MRSGGTHNPKEKTVKKPRNNKGQAMVEYIIIVVLIAVTLIVLFSKFGKAIGKNVAGAAEVLDSNANAAGDVDKISPDSIRDFSKDGTLPQ